jgi:hypothetical protein
MYHNFNTNNMTNDFIIKHLERERERERERDI